jgi:hypothetical protein
MREIFSFKPTEDQRNSDTYRAFTAVQIAFYFMIFTIVYAVSASLFASVPSTPTFAMVSFILVILSHIRTHRVGAKNWGAIINYVTQVVSVVTIFGGWLGVIIGILSIGMYIFSIFMFYATMRELVEMMNSGVYK